MNQQQPDLNDSLLPQPDFDTMTPAQFEHYLPELFAAGSPSLSSDTRLRDFLARNPNCAALVRDLEAIARAASGMFEVELAEPSDTVWNKIKQELGDLDVDPLAESK